MMKSANNCNGRGLFPPIELNRIQVEALAQDVIAINVGVLAIRGFSVSNGENSLYTDELASRIESVFCSVFVPMFGVEPSEKYSDLFQQISSFAEYLANDHIFTDGNKRTTVKFSLGFLASQGVELDIADENDPEKNEVYKWIQDVVTKQKTADDLAALFRDHLVISE